MARLRNNCHGRIKKDTHVTLIPQHGHCRVSRSPRKERQRKLTPYSNNKLPPTKRRKKVTAWRKKYVCRTCTYIQIVGCATVRYGRTDAIDRVYVYTYVYRYASVPPRPDGYIHIYIYRILNFDL